MKTPRIFGTLVRLAWLVAGLSGCDNTPTSSGGPASDSAKSAGKTGPAISLSLAPKATNASDFLLSGTVGTTGSVSVSTSLTLSGFDRSSDFSLPPSKVVTAPYDLNAITISARSTALPGNYILTLTATDSLGNTSRATCMLSLKQMALGVAPVILGFSFDNVTPGTGTTIFTRGIVDFGTDKATVSYSVSGGGANKIFLPATFTVNASGSSIGKQIQIAPDASNGTYTVTVTVTDEDGGVASTSAAFSLYSNSTGIVFEMLEPDLFVGAQRASAGAFIDVNGGVVYTSGSKTDAVLASIDVIFFADATDQISLMSPSYAASNSLGTIINWTTRNSTIIVDAGTSPITDLKMAMSKIGSSTSQVASVVSGHYYALKLVNGEYAAIKVVSLSGSGQSSSGSITLFVEP